MERRVKEELKKGGIRPDDKILMLYNGDLKGRVLAYALSRVEKDYPHVKLAALTDPFLKLSEDELYFVTSLGFEILRSPLITSGPRSLLDYYLLRSHILKLQCEKEGYTKPLIDLSMDECSCLALKCVTAGDLSPLSSMLKGPFIVPLLKVSLREIITYSKAVGRPLIGTTFRFGPLDEVERMCWRLLSKASSEQARVLHSFISALEKVVGAAPPPPVDPHSYA